MLIEKSIDSRYQTVSFNINRDIASLYLDFTISGEVILSVRLYNPDGLFIGEVNFGFHRFIRHLYYSKEKTTINGLKHRLIKGEYRLVMILMNPELPEEELSLSINVLTDLAEPSGHESGLPVFQKAAFQEIPLFDENGRAGGFDRITDPACRYYKGDLHGHTNYSDGMLGEAGAADVLSGQRLDFMAFTEHNCIAFGHRETAAKVLIPPAFELTLPDGHLNFYGLVKADWLGDYFKAIHNEDFLGMDNLTAALINTVEPLASVVSINHIFLKPWHFTARGVFPDNINSIEVICDPTYPESPAANDKAAAFLDFLWNKGMRIYGIGGSDSHNLPDVFYEGADLPSIYGDPATYVYCEGLSVDNLLQSLKDGHAYVSRYVSLSIEIAGGFLLPGDELTSEKIRNVGDFDYSVSVENFGEQYTEEEYTGRFILNGEVIEEVVLNSDRPKAILKNVKVIQDNYWWLRFGLYDRKGHIAAYVNPIYFGQKTYERTAVDQLIEEFDLKYDQRDTI